MRELVFRDLCADDADALHELVSRWEVVRNLGSWPWPPDRAFTLSRCRPFEGQGFSWGIFASGRMIGTVAVTDGVLGYMVHPDFQGQGVIKTAVPMALSEAFLDPSLLEIQADIWADNAISRRVLQGFGFTLRVQETAHALARDEPTASETWHLTRAYWQTRAD